MARALETNEVALFIGAKSPLWVWAQRRLPAQMRLPRAAATAWSVSAAVHLAAMAGLLLYPVPGEKAERADLLGATRVATVDTAEAAAPSQPVTFAAVRVDRRPQVADLAAGPRVPELERREPLPPSPRVASAADLVLGTHDSLPMAIASRHQAVDAPEVAALSRHGLTERTTAAPVVEAMSRAIPTAVGAEEELPALLQNTPPRYPAQAVLNHWEGTVLLRVQLSLTGAVEQVSVATSSGRRLLDETAAAAVRRWRFRAARRNGQPVASTVLLPVVFELTPVGARLGMAN